MNSKILKIGLSIATVLVMTSCSDDDATSITNPEDVTPTTEYDCESPDGTQKIGADGQLVADCTTGSIAFADGVSSMNIAQMTAVETISMESSTGDTAAVVTRDLQAGTEKIVGTHSVEGDIDCTIHYTTPTLPIYIENASDLEDLTYMEYTGMEYASDDCPTWISAVADDDDATGSYVSNVTFTEDSDVVSHVSVYYED